MGIGLMVRSSKVGDEGVTYTLLAVSISGIDQMVRSSKVGGKGVTNTLLGYRYWDRYRYRSNGPQLQRVRDGCQ